MTGRNFTFRREWILLGVLLTISAVMSQLSEGFLDYRNLLDLSTHLAEIGIIACGMTLVIMTGGIDLSVGSLLALSGIVLGYTWEKFGLGPAMGLALLTGLAGGAFNGMLVTRWKLPALVVTLATMALFRGTAMVISKAQPVSNFEPWFFTIGQGKVGDVPVQLIVWVGIVALFALLMEGTPVGRYTIAAGDNLRAARFAALPVQRLTFWIYSVTGLLSGFAAVIFTSRVSTAKSDAMMNLPLEVITAVVLGGTAITGGRGTVIGTFLGVLILGVLRQGLMLAGISSVWREMLTGGLLITTAIVNQRMLERSARRTNAKPSKGRNPETRENAPAEPAASAVASDGS